MYKGNKILLIIIARGGSKRLPDKNIRILHGKPMIYYAIRAAIGSKYADHIVVSTDSKKIAKVSKKYGAEVPFMRPVKLSTDTVAVYPVLQHAVNFYVSKKFYPDIIMLVKPTSPLVLSKDIDGVVKKLFETKTKSCFSACEITERPEWMYKFNKHNKPQPFIKRGNDLNAISQDLPKLYRINGAVYAMKKDLLMGQDLLFSDYPSMYIMPRERSVDIDDLFDFNVAAMFMKELKLNV